VEEAEIVTGSDCDSGWCEGKGSLSGCKIHPPDRGSLHPRERRPQPGTRDRGRRARQMCRLRQPPRIWGFDLILSLSLINDITLKRLESSLVLDGPNNNFPALPPSFQIFSTPIRDVRDHATTSVDSSPESSLRERPKLVMSGRPVPSTTMLREWRSRCTMQDLSRDAKLVLI